jgi:dsRNA-specific ribonuclease
MGIVALREPPSAIPTPLHKLALSMKSAAREQMLRINHGRTVSASEALHEMAASRQVFLLNEDGTWARETVVVERILRSGNFSAAVAERFAEILRQRDRMARVLERTDARLVRRRRKSKAQPSRERPPRALDTAPIPVIPEPVGRLPGFPDISGIPPLSPRMRQWIADLGLELTDTDERWVQLASVHSSFFYESLKGQDEVGSTVLGMLKSTGEAWMKVAIMEAYRSRLHEFDTAQTVSLSWQPLGSLQPAFSKWISGLDSVVAGMGEQSDERTRGRTSVNATVAYQVIGALCLIFGGSKPASALIATMDLPALAQTDFVTIAGNATNGMITYEFRREGPDHDAFFTAVATAAGRQARGSGTSKKDARKAAAKEFLTNHFPSRLEQQENPQRPNRPTTYREMPSTWAKAIADLSQRVQLPPELTMQSLTHPSWTYENKTRVNEAHQRDNSVLAAEGSVVLQAVFAHFTTLQVLGKTLSPNADQARLQTIPREDLSAFSEELSLRALLLLSNKSPVSAAMMADVVQSLFGALRRERSGDQPMSIPAALLEWLESLDLNLDPATRLETLCSQVWLDFDYSHERRGPDHQQEFRATVQLKDANLPTWTGPWASSKTKARQAAAAEIVSIRLEGPSAVPEPLSEAAQQVLLAFFTAELRRLDAPRESAATPRFSVNLLADGAIDAYREWANGLDQFVTEGGAVQQKLEDYFTRWLTNDLKGRIHAETKRMRATSSAVHRTGGMLEARLDLKEISRLSLWSDFLVAFHSDAEGDVGERPPSQERAKQQMPGWLPVLRFVQGFADRIAAGAGRVCETLIDADERADVLMIRVPGLDLQNTMGEAMDVASRLVPGLTWVFEEDGLIVEAPLTPATDSPLTNSGLRAMRRSFSDPHFGEVGEELQARTSELQSIAERLEVLVG